MRGMGGGRRSLHAPMGERTGGLGTRPESRSFSDRGDYGNRREAFDASGWAPGDGNPFGDAGNFGDFGRGNPFEDRFNQERSMGVDWASPNPEWRNQLSDWRDTRPDFGNVRDWVAARPEIAPILANLRARFMGGRA